MTQFARPRPWRRFAVTFVYVFDGLILLAPVVAFFLRLEIGEVREPMSVLWKFGLIFLVVALVLAGLRLLSVKTNPRDAARRMDEMGGTQELFLTSADYLLGGKSSRLLPLLLARASVEMKTLSRAARPRMPIPLPAVKRDILAIALTVLVLMVPSFAHGALGPEDSSMASQKAGDDKEEESPFSGEEAGQTETLGLQGKVKLRAHSDRKLYMLGDEITLILEIESLEPSPEGLEIGAVALVDGEVNMLLPLPLGTTLPQDVGGKLILRLKIKEQLKQHKRYRRGLLAIDPFVYAKNPEPGYEGPVSGGRVVIQIAENAEKLRAKTPSAAKKKQKKKKQPKKPKKKKKQTDKKPKADKKSKKPRQAPGKQPAPKDPGEIKSSPVVVQPLFSGDQTKKRKVRVFDRDKEKGSPPPGKNMSQEFKTRGYQRVEEAELQKLKLGTKERRLVRKYLDGIRKGKTTTEKK